MLFRSRSVVFIIFFFHFSFDSLKLFMLESESLCGGHLFLLSRKKDCLFWKISIDSVVWFEYVVGSFAGLVFENRIAVLK